MWKRVTIRVTSVALDTSNVLEIHLMLRTAPVLLGLVILLAPTQAWTQQTPGQANPAKSSPERIRTLISELGPVIYSECANESMTPGGRAISALISIGRPAVPDLIVALHHADTWKRYGAALVLAKVGDKRCIGPLIGVLRNDPKPSIRNNVAFFLGRLRTSAAIPALEEALHDQDEDVQKQAREALVLIRQSVPIGPLTSLLEFGPLDNRAKPQWFRLGPSDNRTVQELLNSLPMAEPPDDMDTIRELAIRGDRQAVPALLRVMETSRYKQATAAEALGLLGDRRAVGPLLQALRRGRSHNAYLAEMAAVALARLGVREAVPDLMDCLSSQNAGVRSAACAALGVLRAGSATGKLRELLDDRATWGIAFPADDEPVCIVAAAALQKISSH